MALRIGSLVLALTILAVGPARAEEYANVSTVDRSGCCQRIAAPRPIWAGGFDTGDLSQWDGTYLKMPDRVSVVTTDGPVIPREGTHMARIEVRSGDHPPWGDVGTETSTVFRSMNVAGHFDVLGSDRYYAFSMYLPAGFPFVPNQLFNIVWEQHGDNDLEAPAKVIIDSIIRPGNRTPSIAFELNAGPGVAPSQRRRVWRLGDVVYGRWVDVIVHIKWARHPRGKVEVWLNGVRKVSVDKISTWYDSGQSKVSTHVGYYREVFPRTATLYLDAFKSGTSYASVTIRAKKGT